MSKNLPAVQSKSAATPVGVTGKGFLLGQSGNPGGRAKGLQRRVRELVGDDGERIAAFLLDVLNGAELEGQKP